MGVLRPAPAGGFVTDGCRHLLQGLFWSVPGADAAQPCSPFWLGPGSAHGVWGKGVCWPEGGQLVLHRLCRICPVDVATSVAVEDYTVTPKLCLLCWQMRGISKRDEQNKQRESLGLGISAFP